MLELLLAHGYSPWLHKFHERHRKEGGRTRTVWDTTTPFDPPPSYGKSGKVVAHQSRRLDGTAPILTTKARKG